MKERIQKIISQRGIASRRQAERMITEGRIICNGMQCELGQTVDPVIDEILVDGMPLPSTQKNIYIMLHKPKGFVTTLSDEKGRKNVVDLVHECGVRVYPVGRLDMDSEGLLILTNDGSFANKLMHPKHEVEKEYSVHVANYSPEALDKLARPIFLDGYRIAPPDVHLISVDGTNAVVRVTIHEGRNRQVRRMCAKAGMRVKRLIRQREGSLLLGDLPYGHWRYLSANEVSDLVK